MNGVRLTHIGGPTVLIEAAGWRLLVDLTFDPPGRRYAFRWGTSSRKVTGPAVGSAIPVHYEGWTHFREGRDAVEAEFTRAPAEAERLRWLPLGVGVDLAG